MIKPIKFKKKEYRLAKYLVIHLMEHLRKQHPKLKLIDSNFFHYVIYTTADKYKLPITRGWFKNGMYCPVVDDVLIDLNWMDKKQHQLYGNETPMNKLIECECHKK